ncbi:glycosyltransferase [Curtobacterium sp. PhB146]|uniref:glycosyltransferase n=1 Tax=Curtobacterium sp. PhB146 TaxID=2485187 RepID=UPI0010454332|nr:glycosyltransferase [Curtobacterium sp. PhB146]TCU44467.1 glycosyltransferase involved in cell wall biosynthesis [Curtobacterium sp. PhB146]
MHVLQFCDTLATSNGGPARNAFELNRALNASTGLQVDLVWIRGDRQASVLELPSAQRPRNTRPGPRQLKWRARPGDADLVSFGSVVRALRQNDAVIVHGFYLPWVPFVLAAAFILRKPVVLMPHGALTSYETSKKSAKKAWFRRVFRPLVRRTVRALAVGSSREAEEAAVVLPGVAAAVCGVGTSMVGAPVSRDVTTHLRLLTLCRLAKKKRIDVAILAVGKLRSMGIEARLVIAGAGDELVNLKRLTRNNSLEDSVRFVGEVTGQAKRKVFEGADVFLLPSEDENFGIVVAEALANGVPVVASEHVQAASIAAYSPAVKLATSPDPDMVARLVEEFATEEQSALREAALEVAAAEFGWERVAQRWVAVLREATGDRIG